MRRKIKTHKLKNKRHFLKLKYILFLFLAYLSYDTTYSVLVKKNINLSSSEILKLLVSESNHNIVYNYKSQKIINKAISFLSNVDLNKPESILDISFLSESTTSDETVNETHSDDYDPNTLDKVTDYIEDPNPTVIDKPRVYIYNSHQLENYNAANLEIYNITPNVMMASYILKEKLNSLGIPSIVEDSNLTEFMRINNWDHDDSYKASRIYILDAKNKYDTLEYYIDIHRDSVKKEASTKTINGKKYARTLFVVGLENSNYQGNLLLANDINDLINEKYPGLSRGILKKQGKGVNGIYNQDISPNIMLLEVGGVDNNIEEVLNTVEAISKVLFEYIEGNS